MIRAKNMPFTHPTLWANYLEGVSIPALIWRSLSYMCDHGSPNPEQKHTSSLDFPLLLQRGILGGRICLCYFDLGCMPLWTSPSRWPLEPFYHLCLGDQSPKLIRSDIICWWCRHDEKFSNMKWWLKCRTWYGTSYFLTLFRSVFFKHVFTADEIQASVHANPCDLLDRVHRLTVASLVWIQADQGQPLVLIFRPSWRWCNRAAHGWYIRSFTTVYWQQAGMLKSMSCRLMIFCVKKRALCWAIIMASVSTTASSDRCILLQSCGSSGCCSQRSGSCFWIEGRIVILAIFVHRQDSCFVFGMWWHFHLWRRVAFGIYFVMMPFSTHEPYMTTCCLMLRTDDPRFCIHNTNACVRHGLILVSLRIIEDIEVVFITKGELIMYNSV